MRRALVLTSESARHPFRASLPPCALRGGRQGISHPLRRDRRLLTRQDLRHFVLSYCASLLALSLFLI
jgi:hypothetical protein